MGDFWNDHVQVICVGFDPPKTPCDQCGADMNPAERMLGPVCGKCCRANQKEVTG